MAELAGLAGRVCFTCHHFRPAPTAPTRGECAVVLRGRYWIKGDGPRRLVTITDSKLEGCSGGWQARGGGGAR
jgi:hypothetical protein